MTRPNVEQLSRQIDGLVEQLATAKTVVPALIEHHRRERSHLDGLYRTSPRGELLDEEYGLDYQDPTGELVVNTRPSTPSYDSERITGFLAALTALVGATRAVLNQLPAVSRSVNAGHPPTDGRTQDEWEQARYTHALEAESSCLACDEPVSAAGNLRGGLCSIDHQAWVDAGLPDRGLWLAAYRGTEAPGHLST